MFNKVRRIKSLSTPQPQPLPNIQPTNPHRQHSLSPLFDCSFELSYHNSFDVLATPSNLSTFELVCITLELNQHNCQLFKDNVDIS